MPVTWIESISCQYVATHQVFLQLGKHFGEDKVVVYLETLQLGKSWNEETWEREGKEDRRDHKWWNDTW